MKTVKLVCGKYDIKTSTESNVIDIPEKEFLIDGCSVADRLLEGVLFKVKFDSSGSVLDVEVDADSKEYFEQFNTKEFYLKIKKYAKEILAEGDEVDLPEYLKNKYIVNGRNFAQIIVV